MSVKAIIARRCIDGTFLADAHVTAVEVEGETYYVSHAAIEDASGPGRWQGETGEQLALGLVLEHLDQDGGADWTLSDESGYCAQIDRHLLLQDSSGFMEVRSFATAALAEKEMSSYEDQGMGASEDDAYISYENNGIGVSFGGKHIGRFNTLRRAKACVSVEMRKSGYYPNVFLCGEHGPTIRRIDVW
jgi:hypothetical protein